MDKQLQEMDKQPQAKENNQSVDIASVTAISHVTSECGSIWWGWIQEAVTDNLTRGNKIVFFQLI